METQVKENSIDLTVSEVYALEGKGALDFGGSEYTEPRRGRLQPVKEGDDEYGWWDLKPGTYLITLNEVVSGLKGVGFLSPHPRLLKAGATHPTLFTMEWKKDYILPIEVSMQGLKIKENARVSKLMVLRL